MSKELYDIIEKEELLKDNKKLCQYNYKQDIYNIINNVRDELADTTNNIGELTMIYKFAEILKKGFKQ